MIANRPIWKNSFVEGNFPKWPCPNCHKGTLNLKTNSLLIAESVESVNAHKHGDWDPEWITGHFRGTLVCNNQECKENVFIIGLMNVQMDTWMTGVGYESETEINSYLTPISFTPTLSLFQIHNDVPNEIRQTIHNSFKLYWTDEASCANKIRAVIEQILTQQKIPRFKKKNGERNIIPLHQRIESFGRKYSELGSLLMAIKWIGNTGSHYGINLQKDDLLDAYDILNTVITNLYEKDSSKIKQMAKKINKLKKPLGLKKIRRKRKK